MGLNKGTLDKILDQSNNSSEVLAIASQVGVFYKEMIPGRNMVFVPFSANTPVLINATRDLFESYSPCELSIDGKRYNLAGILEEVEERSSKFQDFAWLAEGKDFIRIFYKAVDRQIKKGIFRISKSIYENSMPTHITLPEARFIKSLATGEY